nr:MAG TPA: hypothetical protein [Caudoviricetes sp.]
MDCDTEYICSSVLSSKFKSEVYIINSFFYFYYLNKVYILQY